MLSKVTGLYRLTRDAELKFAPSGAVILKLGLVNSEKYKDKETTLFIDGTVFGKPAEIINQYAGKKGTQIFLSGKLQTESWQDNNGQNRSKISMIIEGFDFVSSGNNQQPQQSQGYNHSGDNMNRPSAQEMNTHNTPPQNNQPQLDMSEEIPF